MTLPFVCPFFFLVLRGIDLLSDFPRCIRKASLALSDSGKAASAVPEKPQK
jgi:hypothetical protein